MKVSFLNLEAAYAELRPELDQAVGEVLRRGRYILGENVEMFEKEFAEYCGARYCVSVGSGLSALELMLKAYQVGPGDEVIVPANTFIATALAVSQVGATPVFVEPEETTYTIDPSRVQEAITKRTRALIAVHLYGQLAAMEALREICDRHRLILLEDAAQAHGAERNGKKAGAWGRAAAFSFYPGKNLGACGDGGAVTTDEQPVAEYIRIARNYGSEKKYYHSLKGVNSRLDEVQAAILRVKLKHLDAWNARRRQLARYYLKSIDPGREEGIRLPGVGEGNTHVWHLFVVRLSRRADLINRLDRRGIGWIIHYPVPPYRQEAYRELAADGRDYPLTDRLSAEVISLPFGPHLPDDAARYVCAAVNEFLREGGKRADATKGRPFGNAS